MEIRRFRQEDSRELSALIRRTLLEVNKADCPAWEIEYLYNKYSPQGVEELARRGHSYTALEEGRPVGCGSILPVSGTESEIAAVFLMPEAIGKGWGRQLLETLERDSFFTGAQRVRLTSSVTALDFYEKLGYRYCFGYRGKNSDDLIEMEKRPRKTAE